MDFRALTSENVIQARFTNEQQFFTRALTRNFPFSNGRTSRIFRFQF